jgi:hypothetical protein
MQTRYDPRTAVTFLLAGLGLGALIALLIAPRPEYGPVRPQERRGRERDREARSPTAV